jgi:hypothetical protein
MSHTAITADLTTAAPLFRSFMLGGFECATHRLRNGRRLDVIASSRHDSFAAADYRRLAALGVLAARDGLRWTRAETRPGRYDFSCDVPLVRAARDAGVQVVWDLFHYGWPDDVDIWTPQFVTRFARFARAAAQLIRDETDDVPMYAPVNEISFLGWGGGDVAWLNPFAHARGFELKCQLARAAVEAIEAIWDVDPRARIVHPDPVIHIVPDPARPDDAGPAEGHRSAMYQAWDMLAGRLWPQLGGDPKYLDVVGVNYYNDNQWIHGGPRIHRDHELYRPFHDILREVHERYGRPMLIAETGIEGDARPDWLRFIGREVRAAIRAGVPIEGICLYPIVNHPGWDDDRHCHNGLWDYADDRGEREAYGPLSEEIVRQQRLFAALHAPAAPLAEYELSAPLPG